LPTLPAHVFHCFASNSPIPKKTYQSNVKFIIRGKSPGRYKISAQNGRGAQMASLQIHIDKEISK
jgi:hypothetical protein